MRLTDQSLSSMFHTILDVGFVPLTSLHINLLSLISQQGDQIQGSVCKLIIVLYTDRYEQAS